jgi:hypothetical protein
MPDAAELAEQIEEAKKKDEEEDEAESKKGGKPPEGEHAHGHLGRRIGITMAILGVLLAICAAMVGGERTELVRSMVEHADADNVYEAESVKYRTMMSELKMLDALTPNHAQVAHFSDALAKMRKDAGKGDASNAETMGALELAVKELAEVLAPDNGDLKDFSDTIAKYQTEREAARSWTLAYQPVTDGHSAATEHYEKAQLLSEIGIVVASIALLLSNRLFWYAAIVAGLSCAGILGWTYWKSGAQLRGLERHLEELHAAYDDLHEKGEAKKADEDLLGKAAKGNVAGQFDPGSGASEPAKP